MTDRSIDVGGAKRRYLIYAPKSYDGTRATPVVYLFHGLGGTADTFLPYTRLAEVANKEGFLIVVPQAAGPRAEWDAETAATKSGTDGTFIANLITQVDASTCADPKRRFAAGMSDGAALTFALACSGDYGFAAYGAVSAAFYRPQCDKSPAAPIVYFHGTADKVVPINGGATPLQDVMPAIDSLHGWAAHDGCAAKPTETSAAVGVTELSWQGCANGSALDYYRIKGTGHVWPGGYDIPGLGLGKNTQAINAGEIMWTFFASHPAA